MAASASSSNEGFTVESVVDTISQNSAPNSPAAVAKEASSLRLIGDTVTGPSNNHTVLVSQGSSALIHSSSITADTPFNASNQLSIITVEGTSTATVAGGNTITNNAAGGLAVIVSTGSTLKENNGTSSGFSAANDSITGDGRIHTQSVIELGSLLGTTTLTWNGSILLSQASSFVADGGNVTVNGTLTLGQSANGYFNHSAGTSNNITQVKCTSTTDHVAHPTLVNPNVTIGAPPNCALF